MGELLSNDEIVEKVILLGVSTSDNDDTATSLNELSELVDTSGAKTLEIIIQNREKIHPGTYLGKGKIEEVRERISITGATGVVCDDELSPAQLKNLQDALGTKVMDRTMVILDIFAKHATTSEGKIQVELAQLKYSAIRLVGMRASLSRLGGGIGTRGPGEKKLEMDRRVIHERIGQLKEQLRNISKHRELTRKTREQSHVFVAAIVGYTNAGKSTLLNTLTDANILAQDQLFATLDPTTRKLVLDGGREMLLTDTVGFIRKLPHHLIEAFRSTLDEAKYADLIIHVVDCSNPQADMQMLVVYDTLKSLGILDKEVLTVYNKIDASDNEIFPRDFHADYTAKISAKTGEGIEELKQLLGQILRSKKIYMEKLFAYNEAGLLQLIRSEGELVSEEYTDSGIEVKAWVSSKLYGKLM